jgi:hypothetical protein
VSGEDEAQSESVKCSIVRPRQSAYAGAFRGVKTHARAVSISAVASGVILWVRESVTAAACLCTAEELESVVEAVGAQSVRCQLGEPARFVRGTACSQRVGARLRPPSVVRLQAITQEAIEQDITNAESEYKDE